MTNHHNMPFCKLSNGITLVVDGCGDADGQTSDNGWAQISIWAQYPNGDLVDLCNVVFDDDTGKLSIYAFDGADEAPAYVCSDYQFDEMEE